ncbi:ketoacyl-synthetase C-terminal extension domain-containing protein [Tistrella bauzanensis]
MAQAAVIRDAWRRAGAPLHTASYIEAHGTGTRLGDPIEIEGLTRAAADGSVGSEAAPALIGSAKGNYGHLDTVAGALGLVRAVAALAHDTAPPQPFFTRPNPAIDFTRAPVRVADRPTPLPDRGTRRRAGVSAFGLSGINVHAVIEAAPPPATIAATDHGWAVVVLSAGDDAALTAYAGALHTRLIADPAITPAEVAHTLAHGRDHLARCAAWRWTAATLCWRPSPGWRAATWPAPPPCPAAGIAVGRCRSGMLAGMVPTGMVPTGMVLAGMVLAGQRRMPRRRRFWPAPCRSGPRPCPAAAGICRRHPSPASPAGWCCPPP